MTDVGERACGESRKILKGFCFKIKDRCNKIPLPLTPTISRGGQHGPEVSVKSLLSNKSGRGPITLRSGLMTPLREYKKV